MVRKFSALVFLAVMALLITFKHPVLGYCFCLDAYFAGSCQCSNVLKAADTSIQSATEDALNPNTSSCCSKCSSKESTAVTAELEDQPCDDCTEHLNIEVGDFYWTGVDASVTDEESKEPVTPVHLSLLSMRLGNEARFLKATAVRGSPHSEFFTTHPPALFLRFETWLL